ncbi:FG-GAP repeat domain-containing protein [Lentzea sp. NPDC004789]
MKRVLGWAAALTMMLGGTATAAVPGKVAGTDFDGDGRTDLALLGEQSWRQLPVASSTGSGGFRVSASPVGDFAAWSSGPNVKSLAGDFDGDGRTDIALTGAAGWTTIPVAFSRPGGFAVTNFPAAQFAQLAAQPAAQAVVGDYNNDGRADISLVGVNWWHSVPVAFSNGDGRFTTTNVPSPEDYDFQHMSGQAGARVLAGDYNGDGRTDLAATGIGPDGGWPAVPIGLSNGDGSFTSLHVEEGNPFPEWAGGQGVHISGGDFNRDGRTDLALTGHPGWTTAPVALSRGDGTFQTVNGPVGDFAVWASGTGVKTMNGDFNGDGLTDIALTGHATWTTIPVAHAVGDGTWRISNAQAGSFSNWAAAGCAEAVTGDFNADGRSDLALTGCPDWTTLPVAFAKADGGWTVTNEQADAFALLSGSQASKVVAKPENRPRA